MAGQERARRAEEIRKTKINQRSIDLSTRYWKDRSSPSQESVSGPPRTLRTRTPTISPSPSLEDITQNAVDTRDMHDRPILRGRRALEHQVGDKRYLISARREEWDIRCSGI